MTPARWVVLLVVIQTASGVCTGIGGDFCEGTCCLWSNGSIAYCCSNFPFPTKCCGLGMCCPEESTCSMNCTSNSTTCLSGTPAMSFAPTEQLTTKPTTSAAAPVDRDDEACDLSLDQCCVGTCCQSCCGGTICAPDNHVCCNPPAGSAMEPTSFCPSTEPACCLATDGNTTCCAPGSSCCTEGSCPADSTCCGSCNCCNTKTQRCLDDGTCQHVPEGVAIPVLIWLWGFAFFMNLAFLGMKYYDYLNLDSVNSSVCLECFHPAHCSAEMCTNKRANTSPDCATCAVHCRRTYCHLGPCGLPYTAQERMMREGDEEGETVSFKVVHGKCPCEECQCSRCVPYFACWCTQCGCVVCKTSHKLRPFVSSLVVGVVVLLTTTCVHGLADQNDCTTSLVIFSVAWVLVSMSLVGYLKYLKPRRKAAAAVAAASAPKPPLAQDPTPQNTTNAVPEAYADVPTPYSPME